MTSVVNFIRRKPKDKLNILTFPTHERYETELSKTGHNFYSVNLTGMAGVKDYGLPNYHLMKQDDFYPYNGYDLILSQSRFGQFRLATQINQKLQIPIITLEHTVPTTDLSTMALREMGRMVGDVNVFICEYSRSAWSALGVNRNNNVILHSVDTDVFKPTISRTGGYVLTVANDFQARDYCLNYSLWQSVNSTKNHDMVVLGSNSDKISKYFSSANDAEELCNAYSGCKVYLNTTSHSSIPMSLLEAMACECPIVTTNTCGIGEFIEHEHNGLIANTTEEIDSALTRIKENPELAATMGKNARQTILTKCSQERFINQWNEIFTKTYEASL